MKANLTATVLVCSLLQISVANASTTELNTQPIDANVDQEEQLNIGQPSTVSHDEQASELSAALSLDEPTTDQVIETPDTVADSPLEQETIPQEINTETDAVEEHTLESAADETNLEENAQETVGEAPEVIEEQLEQVVEDSEDVILDEHLDEEVSAVTEEELATNSGETYQESDPALESTLEELSNETMTDEYYVEEVTSEESLFDADISGEESLGIDDEINPDAYNFERPLPQEGDVYLPVMSDARVFAEFIDGLPAIVNYYTDATEEEITAFYVESFGEAITEERKRNRLTISFYLDGTATRVVISQQDNYRQVDVMQEEAF